MFFFFKQKTAYEMRISDWSSDVCSSDLPAPGIRAGALAGDGHVVALVAFSLQAVDEQDGLRRRAVKQHDVGRVEPAGAQRRSGEPAVSRPHARHLRLVHARRLLVLKPHAGHLIAGEIAFARRELRQSVVWAKGRSAGEETA